MNYTQNHHLPQWVKSDRIMMDDFNQAMSKLESSLTANAQAAANAQSTANAAKSAASSAQSAANSALSSKPYVTGTYAGTGAAQTINLGFRPSFVIINSLEMAGMVDQVPKFGVYSAATNGSGNIDESIQFTSSGFKVFATIGVLPKLSESKRVYEYIAFK